MTARDDIFQKVLEKRGGDPSVFRDRNNPDPAIVRTRQLAAAALVRHFGDERDDRIQARLDCSLPFVKISNGLSMTDTDFRSELQEILGAKETSPEKPATEQPAIVAEAPTKKKGKGEDESVEDFLLRVAQETYGFDRLKMVIKRNNSPETADARKVLAFIASEAFGRKPLQIQHLFDCELRTTRYMLGESRRAYSRSAAFKMRVVKLCKEYDILLPE